MIRLLAQCPCSGGGGGIDPFLALGFLVGLFGLAKWIGSVRSRKDLSGMNKAARIGILVLLLVIVVLVIAIKTNGPDGMPTSTGPTTSDAVASQPAGGLPRLVDLGSDKCIPCKMMAPILEELKAEYAGRLRVDVYDVWENRGLGEKFGIRVIPTQIFYDATGKELYRHEGFISKEDILAKWRQLGVDLNEGEAATASGEE